MRAGQASRGGLKGVFVPASVANPDPWDWFFGGRSDRQLRFLGLRLCIARDISTQGEIVPNHIWPEAIARRV